MPVIKDHQGSVISHRRVKLLAIVGPTASGKTALAIKLAKLFNGEIIAADSRTIYKYLDIGTAKPTQIEQAAISHWGLDLVEPGQVFTVADYKQYANNKIAIIQSSGKLPILVGGSGLYIDAILYDFSLAPTNEDLRQALADFSIEQLQQQIIDNDLTMPSNKFNKRYLVRTLERGAYQPIKQPLRSGTIIIGVNPTPEELKKRITLRTIDMVEQGIIEEVKRVSKLYGWESTAMSGNAYRVFRDVINASKSLDQAMAELISSDVKLSKKQKTWFKRNHDIHWFKDDSQAFNWFIKTYSAKL